MKVKKWKLLTIGGAMGIVLIAAVSALVFILLNLTRISYSVGEDGQIDGWRWRETEFIPIAAVPSGMVVYVDEDTGTITAVEPLDEDAIRAEAENAVTEQLQAEAEEKYSEYEATIQELQAELDDLLEVDVDEETEESAAYPTKTTNANSTAANTSPQAGASGAQGGTSGGTGTPPAAEQPTTPAPTPAPEPTNSLDVGAAVSYGISYGTGRGLKHDPGLSGGGYPVTTGYAGMSQDRLQEWIQHQVDTVVSAWQSYGDPEIPPSFNVVDDGSTVYVYYA